MLTKYFNELQKELGRNTGKYLSNRFFGDYGWATPRRYQLSTNGKVFDGQSSEKLSMRKQELLERKAEDETKRRENRKFVADYEEYLDSLAGHHRTRAKFISEWPDGYGAIMGFGWDDLSHFFLDTDKLLSKFLFGEFLKGHQAFWNVDQAMDLDFEVAIKDSLVLKLIDSQEAKEVQDLATNMFLEYVSLWRHTCDEEGNLPDDYIGEISVSVKIAKKDQLDIRMATLNRALVAVKKNFSDSLIPRGIDRIKSIFKGPKNNAGYKQQEKWLSQACEEFENQIRRVCEEVQEHNHKIYLKLQFICPDFEAEQLFEFFDAIGYFDRFREPGMEVVLNDFSDRCLTVDLIVNTEMTVPRTEFKTLYNDSRLKEEVMTSSRRNAIIFEHVTSLTIALLSDISSFNHPGIRWVQFRTFVPGANKEDVLAIAGKVDLVDFIKDWSNASGKALQALSSIQMDFRTRSGFQSVDVP